MGEVLRRDRVVAKSKTPSFFLFLKILLCVKQLLKFYNTVFLSHDQIMELSEFNLPFFCEEKLHFFCPNYHE